MPDLSSAPLIAQAAAPSFQHRPYTRFVKPGQAPSSHQMAPAATGPYCEARTKHAVAWVVASGVVDWLLVVATAVGGYFLGRIAPNKRPFQLEDPEISFPYTVHETVSSRNLVIATIVVPVVGITIVSLAAVPGATVPPGTSRSLVWRRKLWELYASLLSYALGMASQWFIVNGLKNVCGKPRPDLLARCQPDIQHVARYVVGGIANVTSNGQLVSASICTNTDTSMLNDGFRSYPSGHSSSSAAGLGYLALFLAFKLGVVFPFAPIPTSREDLLLSVSAFPSQTLPRASRRSAGAYELDDMTQYGPWHQGPQNESRDKAPLEHAILSTRRGSAAPPLYLLVIVLVPFCGSVFIAASRWFNFRHHGFDILFGYFIGTITALVAFRMYQLPLSHGAGWAWGPRNADKAFWAGVGSNSWATPWQQRSFHSRGEGGVYEAPERHATGTPDSPVSQRLPASQRVAAGGGTHMDIEETC